MMMNMANSSGKTVIFILLWEYNCASVQLSLDQPKIELGQPLSLTCELLSGNTVGNRRWVGGKQAGILCFNGIPTDPVKYKELQITSKNYRLEIANVSESDLDCPYACHVGFQTGERMISVDKSNFKYLPKEGTTHIEYVKTNGSYSLRVQFHKVFPIPSCTVKTQIKLKKLTVTEQNRIGIFYDVQYSDQSIEPFHICDSPVEIKCLFPDAEYEISHQHSFECSRYIPASNGSHAELIVPVVIGLLVVLALVILVIFIIKIYRGRNNRNVKDAEINDEFHECSYPLNNELNTPKSNTAEVCKEDSFDITFTMLPDEKMEKQC